MRVLRSSAEATNEVYNWGRKAGVEWVSRFPSRPSSKETTHPRQHCHEITKLSRETLSHVNRDEHRTGPAENRPVVLVQPAVEAAREGTPRRGVRHVLEESRLEGAEDDVRLVQRKLLHKQERLVGVPALPGASWVGEDLDHLRCVFSERQDASNDSAIICSVVRVFMGELWLVNGQVRHPRSYEAACFLFRAHDWSTIMSS